MSYRFRLEGELLVLQVGERACDRYSFDKLVWRDAKVSDIPVRDPFAREPSPAYRDGDVVRLEGIE